VSVSSLITDGFGSFGDVADVVCLGLDIGAAEAALETLGRDGLGGDDAPTRHEVWETRKRKAKPIPVVDEVKPAPEQIKAEPVQAKQEKRPITEQERKEALRLAAALIGKPVIAATAPVYSPQIIIKARKVIEQARIDDQIDDDDEDIFLLM
jgi:hypothetical protein